MSNQRCNKCGGTGTLFSKGCTVESSPCWQCGGIAWMPEITSVCMSCIEKDKRIEQLEAEVEGMKLAYEICKDPALQEQGE